MLLRPVPLIALSLLLALLTPGLEVAGTTASPARPEEPDSTEAVAGRSAEAEEEEGPGIDPDGAP